MPNTLHQATQIAFIDSNVSDRQTLINSIFSDIQVVILNANRDGVEQITEVLSGGNFSAIHIISHGNSDSLQLGIAQLNSQTLTTSYEASIAKWRDSLTPNADILLYGCNVASNNQFLIEKIAQLTGADVAASDDLTGSNALSGDWNLEVNTGLIEAPLAFQVGVMEAYNAVLGTITVNSTADNTISGDGLVTLREAIIAANNDTTTDLGETGSGADTIILSAGSTYNLDAALIAENDGNWGKTGLPAINSEITINGNDATIAGDSNNFRIFRVTTGGNLTLNDLTITNARNQSGAFGGDAGALLNDTGGKVTIRNSTFTNNQALDDGGAILNFLSTMTIENSTISNNKAEGSGSAGGGGIENDNASLSIINSTISGNSSVGLGGNGGGGIRNRNNGNLQIINSTIAFNNATTNGGGLLNLVGNVTVSNSLIARNTFGSDLNLSGADVAGTFTSTGYNLIGNTDGSSDFTNTGDQTGTFATLLDPLLASLANYGGSTQTHALLPGSPAIDAGTTALTTDQRGISRPVNGTADIGAFESRGFTVTITGGNNQNTTVDTAFTNPLNLTVSSAFGEPVNGGQITYTPPASGASATLSSNKVTISGGTASVTATANGTPGTYNVTAGGKGIATSASYTLTNNPLTISIDNPTITEGTGGTKNLTFTISLSGSTTSPVSVDYTAIDVTAKAGSDYTSATGTVNFPAGGATTQTIDIPITTDNINEADETFQVQLSNAVNATISTTAGTGTGTITNDDTPTVSITPVSVAEGTGAGTTTANFTVSLSNPTDTSITVNYSTANGTADSATDYTATTGTLTFDSVSGTSQNIAVNITRDDIYEPDETFTVNLTNTGATNATASATGTIKNDDSLAQISINDVTVTEGNSGTSKATFTVKLSNPSSQEIKVNYATSDGTATTGNIDYTAVSSSTLTFAAGETEKTIDVFVNGDTKFESNETFNVNLTGATNATIADNQGVGTITNDDTQPTISINDVTVTEGNSGTTNATFTVSLSSASSQAITVNYATYDATATTADNDYIAITSTPITFNPGETSKTITVAVNGDTKFESNETFNVDLIGATNATIANDKGIGTITNDDIPPAISIGDVTITEENSGTSKATFTVKLSEASSQAITVNYATSDATATTADNDYTAIPSTTLTFAAGETEKTIDVLVNGDNKFETDETFNVNLAGATNATIADNQGVVTITNDDTQPTISIDDVTVTEVNFGTTTATFSVSLSSVSSETVTVNYATADGTAKATDSDYTSIPTNTLTFAPGETKKTIDVAIIGDNIFEADETFNVNLSGASNATIADGTGIATISNDDSQPTISIGDISVDEGNSVTTKATFTVKLSSASSEVINVNYATVDVTATTANSDYTTISSTPITFNPGETEKTIDVTVNGDTIFETDETFNVDLTGATNATIADNQGVGTITNDDTEPTISINDVTVTEGNSSTSKATFTVKLSSANSQAVTVNYATSDATATTADSDYTAISSTSLTFVAGETEKTIDVLVNGDNKFETDETFNVDLIGATNATIADGTGVGTITNDDTKPTISISPTNITNPEGNSGTTNYTYNVTLSNASNQTVTVNYSTNDGTATVADNDYADNDGNLTFNPGEPLTKTITVNVNGDSKFESDENFTVKLNSATNADLGATTEATGTISNEDIQPTVSISPATITNNEGNSGTTAYTYTVTLSNTTSQPVTVNYSTNDGTATVADNDYVDNDGTLTFNPGELLTKTITVNVNGDSKFETDENFTVRLNSATNAIIGATSQAISTITNDDNQPTISINDVTRSEGKSGTTNFDFAVTLSNVSSLPVTVSYSTADGTATAGSDYIAIPSTQLTFNPGETSKTISVTVNADALIESDENFFVNLSNPANATIVDNQGVGTITNDDNAPTVSNIDKSGNEDSDITFSVADFTNKFSDVDGDSLSKIKVTSLPNKGTLNLGGSNVATNQEIVAGDLGNLRFIPNANWNGSTNFGWNGFDGANYANSGAIVNLIVNPVNYPPLVTIPITSKTAAVNDLFNFTFPADTFQDIDVGDTLTYTATSINGNPLPNWLFFNPFTRNFVGIPTASDVGTFSLILKATDNAGASVTNPFNLTVTNPDFDCFCQQIIRPSLDSLTGLNTNPNSVDVSQFGSNNNDTLAGTNLKEEFYGFDGDDFLLANVGTDNLIGNFGNDTAFGGSERDWISGNSGDDIINGNADDDIINGNESNDIARGGQGNDLVRGGQNDDTIWGDLGDDTLGGDKGNDTVFGGTSELGSTDGRDLIFGGTGNDLLNGNANNDTLFGEDSNDTVRGGQNDDIVCGGSGDDMLFGDRGNDSLCAGDGNDTLYGGNGSDFPIGANGEQDYLCGGLGNDWLFGNEGEDWLNGEAGEDTLFGGKDNDTLIGGADNDRLIGDLGNDFLSGGSGSDLFILTDGKGSDVITDFQDGQDLLGLSGGLTFQDLAISQNNDRTFINLKSNGELLATLYAVQANAIGQPDFISVI